MLSRRGFVTGSMAIGVASRVRAQTIEDPPTVLRLERRDIEVNGKSASVYCIRQPDGTFGITTDVGKPFRVRVENHIEEPSLIHWHGLTPPWRQDGVPETSGLTIPPGRQRRPPFPSAPWRHILDALALCIAGAALAFGAANYQGWQRKPEPGGSRRHARRLQLHPAGSDPCAAPVAPNP